MRDKMDEIRTIFCGTWIFSQNADIIHRIGIYPLNAYNIHRTWIFSRNADNIHEIRIYTLNADNIYGPRIFQQNADISTIISTT